MARRSTLPGSDVRIEEKRIEAAFGATWKPADDWVLEAGMRIEQSSISQTGDTPLQRRFTYPKPRLALRWDAGERNQLRLSLSREVGQLDFSDFVASASLDSGHGQRGQRRTGTGQDLAPGRGLGAAACGPTRR